MVNLQSLQDGAKKFVADNATVFLTAGGVVGTVATGVFAWRGGYKACERHGLRYIELADMAEATLGREPEPEEVQVMSTQEKIVLALPYAAPPIVLGTGTIAAIVFSHRMSAQKAAAMAALYGLSQSQFEEYKKKVAEKLTGPKTQAIKDEIAQDKVNANPPSSQMIIIEGKVLCFDSTTGRYFQSSMEDIKRVVNKVNTEIINCDNATATSFYDELGLEPTKWSDEVGWNLDNRLEVDFSHTLAHDGRPALVIDFVTYPREDYLRRY